MCGRFTQRSPARKVAKQFKVEEVPPLAERYNVAPAQAVLAVRESSGGREAAFFKWGLIPRWAKDPGIGNKLINGRYAASLSAGVRFPSRTGIGRQP